MLQTIFVVSDGSGATAEQVLRAALAQFADAEVKIECVPEVRNRQKVSEVVQRAAKEGGFIVHTFVLDKLREAILEEGRTNNVETIDLMGPLLARLSSQLSISPMEKPGLFREMNEAYFRRIETMEFAIHHDDGVHLEDLPRAEIVLTGVSRTFKTPLSIYLAFKGWLVANVPIVLDMEPPSILSIIPENRVFGLTADPQRLAEVRKTRQDLLGGPSDYYFNLDYVSREVEFALDFFKRKPGWRIIDVTNKSIEEIGSEIIALKPGK